MRAVRSTDAVTTCDPSGPECRTDQLIYMAPECGQSDACRCVPHSRSFVRGRGDDPRTVWAECRTDHSIRMPRQRGQRGACRTVPQSACYRMMR